MDYLRLNPRALARFALVCATLALVPTAWAAPLLHCLVEYAGSTHVVEAQVVSDPYPVPSVDIGGRFRFKAIMVGEAARIDYIVLYAYVDTKRQPVLVQQAKYLPPFRVADPPYSLTGEQYVYAGVVERELHYSCTLQGVNP
ncbi:MAG: hypothetical protein WCK83_09020 [Burkholderiales bacterium]